MNATCPFCAGTGLRPEATDAEIDAARDGLRAACRAAGYRITGDDRVDEATAAALIGRQPGTLRNWRSQHCPLPFLKRGGRVTYALTDVARWMQSGEVSEDQAA